MSAVVSESTDMDAGRMIATEPRGGFTLVEMLVVLALIGMLLGLTSLAVLRHRDSGRVTECQARVNALSMLIDSKAKGTRRERQARDITMI